MNETSTPYRVTPVFDEVSLPGALRREHRTKAGVWGIIRVLEGQLRLEFRDRPTELLTPDKPGMLEPEQEHWVTPLGAMRMQVEFYDAPPIRRN